MGEKTKQDLHYNAYAPQGFVVLLGKPVAHSLSPVMHNLAFETLGLNWVYHAFEVQPDDLEAAMEGLKALNIKGGNVTAPYKIDVINYLDQLTGEAQAAGAVNTLIMEDDMMKGDNTDGEGFVQSLEVEERFNLTGKEILVLGAGGAARGICLSLSKRNLKNLLIVNRTKKKANDLAKVIKRYQPKFTSSIQTCNLNDSFILKKIPEIDLIINTLPMNPPHYLLDAIKQNFDMKFLKEKEKDDNFKLLADLRYGQKKGEYLDDLARHNVPVVDGSGMLLYQGALAFEKWTGLKAPIETMKKAFY